MNPNSLRKAFCGFVLTILLIFAGGAAIPSHSAVAARPLKIGGLELRTPTVAIPYYHFTAALEVQKADTIQIREVRVNGQSVRNYLLFEKDELLEPEQPSNRRRMVIAQALESSRPERAYTQPVLVGRFDWRDNQTYAIKIAAGFGAEPKVTYAATLQTTAPQLGGYWDPAWKHYQSVVVSETAGRDRKGEPLEVTLLFYPDMLADPAREIRVVRFDGRRNVHQIVPSQIIDFARVQATEEPMYDEQGQRKPATFVPSASTTIIFPADVEAGSSSIYLVFYGNPLAAAPAHAEDLTIAGTAPGRVVGNGLYQVKLHDANGMLDEIILRPKPEFRFVHKLETNGAVQWNPDCYAPPRPWVHLSDWEPGKFDYQYQELSGPLVFRTRRWGQMPLMPELACSMEYAFYAGVPWFEMRSSIHVRHDVAVQALRNAEIVFEREAFDEVAWPDRVRRNVEIRRLGSAPDLTEWTMADDTPWIAFFDRKKGCGFAGIQRSYANGGLEGRLRDFNPYMYVTVGPWIYWTRALAYPYGTNNPQQMIPIHAGSVFLEEWAYLPFELGKDKDGLFEEVERWHEILTHPLVIKVVDPIDPRMEVPKEIYVEPKKTGWEKKSQEN